MWRAESPIKRFAYKGRSVAQDIREKYGFDGDLLRMFTEHQGPIVHKWHHYLPLYDRYFAKYRNRPVRFLEIGVAKGGSLQLWRNYFGGDALIYGIDIDPNCAVFDGQAGHVRIGSQDDPEFLSGVIDEMGGVDVVLDDGSHEMAHIAASYRVLFPRLTVGGLYMIEDLHTAFWDKWGGGLNEPANYFNTLREMVDDLHVWYHGQGAREGEPGVVGIHIHDSIAVLEKDRVYRPVHSKLGRRR